MLLDMMSRHWVSIFTIILFCIKLWPRKRFRNTETKYFWITALSCLFLVVEDALECVCATDPSLRFFRILLSVIGYTLPRSGKCRGGGYGNPLQYSCLETLMDRGAWRATVHRVTKTEAT